MNPATLYRSTTDCRSNRVGKVVGLELRGPPIEARPGAHRACVTDLHADPQPEVLVVPELVQVGGTDVFERRVAVDDEADFCFLALLTGFRGLHESRHQRFGRDAGLAAVKPQSAEPFDPADLQMIGCRFRLLRVSRFKSIVIGSSGSAKTPLCMTDAFAR